MSLIDNAIKRLQVLALACSTTDNVIKSAPDYPVDDAKNLPLSIAHLGGGQGIAVNATDLQFEPEILIDFHFSRTHLKDTYRRIDMTAPAFMQRLAGDPQLTGTDNNPTVDTIQFPVVMEVIPAEWDNVTTQMLRFIVPVKSLEVPIST